MFSAVLGDGNKGTVKPRVVESAHRKRLKIFRLHGDVLAFFGFTLNVLESTYIEDNT